MRVVVWGVSVPPHGSVAGWAAAAFGLWRAAYWHRARPSQRVNLIDGPMR